MLVQQDLLAADGVCDLASFLLFQGDESDWPALGRWRARKFADGMDQAGDGFDRKRRRQIVLFLVDGLLSFGELTGQGCHGTTLVLLFYANAELWRRRMPLWSSDRVTYPVT